MCVCIYVHIYVHMYIYRPVSTHNEETQEEIWSLIVISTYNKAVFIYSETIVDRF